jgi:hypothetical protein
MEGARWGKGGEMTQTLYAHMNKGKKRAGRVAQVVGCLPCKSEALSSSTSTDKKKNKIKRRKKTHIKRLR